MGKHVTQEDYIEKVKKVHGDTYDLSKIVYKGTKEKITVICRVHGEFTISAGHFLAGQGCPVCRYIKSANGRRRNMKELVEQARKVHGDKYDYSMITEYKNDRIKYPIVCPEHGVFYQTFNNHIKGEQGCPYCGRKKCDDARRNPFEYYVEEARKIHGDKYQYIYNKEEYKGNETKIEIICPKHGSFFQKFSNHISGKQGCPECAKEKISADKTMSTEEYIEKAKRVHGDKYDYSQTVYNGPYEKIKIICPEHGIFYQSPGNHLCGNGCKKCSVIESDEEINIYEFIKELLPHEEVINGDRKIIKPFELDIYVPSKKIAIEYDGLYWHSEARKEDSNYHLNKTIECEKQAIQLIHIFEDEWIEKEDIVKSRIKSLLGVLDNIIYARKCEVKEVSKDICNEFLENNHLQGKCISAIRLGLFYNEELVSVMTFGKNRVCVGNGKDENTDNSYELLRFCSKLNTEVVGGASKLLKYFEKNYKPKEITTYADRRWSNGEFYKKIGFEQYNISRPSYYYIVNCKRLHRYTLRKNILVEKYNCPPEMTEHDFCFSQGWWRIYDCGCYCFKKEYV